MTGRFGALVVSTPVGAIGSGIGGGVEITVRNIADGLVERGHRIEVVAPAGSVLAGHVVHGIDGALQPSVQTTPRDVAPASTGDGALTNMWRFAFGNAARFDVIVNLAYDELPFDIAASSSVPVAHLVSMCSLTDAMDARIERELRERPSMVAMHSRAQAATFAGGGAATIVGSGIDPMRYRFVERPHPDGRIGFVGRISPEKGFVDAVAVAQSTGRPLHVWGFMQDVACWHDALREHPGAVVIHRGFVPTETLGTEIGECAALVMSPKWVEAFGNVAIEALACGVPVVAYARGGPAEVVVDGETGRLVPPGDVVALAEAVDRCAEISRAACRANVVARHSTAAFAERLENWLLGVVGRGARGADFPAGPLSF